MTSSISRPEYDRSDRPSACRYGRLKSVGCANRNHDLPDAQALRITQRGRRQSRLVKLRTLQADHREVARRVVSDQRCRHAPAIVHGHGDAHRLVHDMTVGEDQAIRSEHESRATAAAFFILRLARACAAGALMYFDIHHRRAHALDRAGYRRRVGIEQGSVTGVVWRNVRFAWGLIPTRVVGCEIGQQTSGRERP